MINLVIKSQKYLESLQVFSPNPGLNIEITEKLNTDRLIVIVGYRGILKTNFIAHIIMNSNYKNNYFYFNKNLDYQNQVKDEKSLFLLYSTYIERYKTPSIIILEDTNNIPRFKEFLAKIYQETDIKIIIIGNNIKISGKAYIRVFSPNVKTVLSVKNSDFDILDLVKFGSFDDVLLLNNDYLKEKYLKVLKEDIIYNDIIKPYSLKSLDLYNWTLIFLSNLDIYSSLRDIHINLNTISKVSVKTLTEYVEYSLESGLISRIYAYDIRKNKEISTKMKYFFADLGIRNILNGFNTDFYTLKENFIYNEFIKKGYVLKGGLSGNFYFSFMVSYQEKVVYYIHLSRANTKLELKKEVSRLLKIKDSINKILIVDSIKKLSIRRTQYDNLEIIEFVDFIKNHNYI